MKLRQMNREGGRVDLTHWCPGCREYHPITIGGKNSNGASWRWNGNMEHPTFEPSVNIRINAPGMIGYQPKAKTSICHYILSGGMLYFQADCTHSLRGQTVELPEWQQIGR